MAEMQINQLPTIPQAPSDDAVLVIEVSGVTYKVSKSALASAIASNIDPDDIGALPDTTTAADIGALPDTTVPYDIGAPRCLYVTTNDTISTVIAKLNQFNSNELGIFWCANGDAAKLLTENKVTSSFRGIIARLSATTFDLFGSIGSGSSIAAGRITVGSTSITASLNNYAPPT